MPLTLYVATSNPGKLRDFAHAATAFPGILLAPLPHLDSIPPPDETADTFAGNALLKALAYSALAPGQIVLADDSGLAVDALNGAPGVRSARFADDQLWPAPGTPDQRNTACLLDRTARVPDKRAAYLCALAAVRDGVLLATGTGKLEGWLIETPRGTSGFGYDPIFELNRNGKTMAEVDPDTRLRLSHRGRALQQLLKVLPEARRIGKRYGRARDPLAVCAALLFLATPVAWGFAMYSHKYTGVNGHTAAFYVSACSFLQISPIPLLATLCTWAATSIRRSRPALYLSLAISVVLLGAALSLLFHFLHDGDYRVASQTFFVPLLILLPSALAVDGLTGVLPLLFPSRFARAADTPARIALR